jgi:hypothetical protein
MLLGFSTEFWVATAVTLIAAAVSIYCALKPRRRAFAVGITRSANLTSEVAREVPNLRVLYQGADVEGELVWLSGVVVNTGSYDIGKSIVSRFVTLELEEGAEWKEFSLAEAAPGIDATLMMHSASKVEVQWGLLRPRELVRFNALVRTSDRSLVERIREGRGINVDARVEDTRCVFDGKFESLASSTEAVRRLGNASVSVMFPLFCVLMWIGLSLFTLLRPEHEIAYIVSPPRQVVASHNGYAVVSIDRVHENSIDLRADDGKKLTVDPKKIHLNGITIIAKSADLYGMLMIGANLILFTFMLAMSLRRASKAYTFFKYVEPEHSLYRAIKTYIKLKRKSA